MDIRKTSPDHPNQVTRRDSRNRVTATDVFDDVTRADSPKSETATPQQRSTREIRHSYFPPASIDSDFVFPVIKNCPRTNSISSSTGGVLLNLLEDIGD